MCLSYKLKNKLSQDISFISIFLIGLLVCISFIGSFPIYILDEAKNSEAAREMYFSGNWFVPNFNRALRTDKPPLHYLFMTLGFKIFGINSVGARFFSGVFGALTLSITYFFVKKMVSTQIATYTWLILLSAIFFIQLFHQAVPDPYLIFFITAGLFSFLYYHQTKKLLHLFLFYTYLALGSLAKGPVAIALPGVIVLLFLFYNKEYSLKKLFSYRPILGLVWIAIIAIPWYYIAHVQTAGAFTEGFFLKHNLNRFETKMEGHGGIFLMTWAFVLLGMLPFSLWIIQSISYAWQKRKNPIIAFALITGLVFILFFSFSGTKLPNYTMPSYPFLAILIASYFSSHINNNRTSRFFTWSFVALLIISLALPFLAYFALGAEMQLSDVQYIGWFMGVASVGGIIGYYAFAKAKLKGALLIISVTWISQGIVLFGLVYPKLNSKNPVTITQSIIPKNAPILVYKRMDAAFPINYNRTFSITHNIDTIELFLENNTKGYIITNTKEPEPLFRLENAKLVLRQKSLFENHYTLVFKSIE